MTERAEKAKAIVLAKYPHAFCEIRRCVGGWKRRFKCVVRKDMGIRAGNWLTGECYSQDAAWIVAAKNVQAEPEVTT